MVNNLRNIFPGPHEALNIGALPGLNSSLDAGASGTSFSSPKPTLCVVKVNSAADPEVAGTLLLTGIESVKPICGAVVTLAPGLDQIRILD